MPTSRSAPCSTRRPVRSLSQQLGRHASEVEVVPVEVLKEGTGVPLFCIHPGSGVSWPYQALGNYLDCPIIGIQRILQGEEAEPRSIRDMAKNYADRIQGVYPTGPYNLLGWSFGGVVAHELAIELQRRGCVIACLILLDAQPSIDSNVTLPNDALVENEVLEEVLSVLSYRYSRTGWSAYLPAGRRTSPRTRSRRISSIQAAFRFGCSKS